MDRKKNEPKRKGRRVERERKREKESKEVIDSTGR